MVNDMSSNATTADPRWVQVLTRDASADGSFVYAVKTTGVFCRPSCPSRPAKPGNLVFYSDTEAAQAAGFRACKRCRPLDPPAADTMTARMEGLATYIRANAAEPLTLAMLARQAGMSPFHLQRRFTEILGVSPKAYHAAERMRGFKARLRAGDDVLGATFEAGYGSTSRIYEQVDGGLGMTPSTYRAGGDGEHITYAVRKTPIGPLLMAATGRGVCCVQFGADADELATALQREFPKATLHMTCDETNPALAAWMLALECHLSQGAPRPDLPLDLRGTAFQIRVWRFLLSVKPGDVVSYSQLAQSIGAPKASRAVGSACAANRVAVLVPCHRALRADGGLGGYRWGLDRKRILLDQERAVAGA